MNPEEKSIWDYLYEAGETITKPAETILSGLEYLDKPRGAITGGVKAALDNTDIIEGIKQGWDKNTSWGEVFLPDNFRKEDPYYAATAAGIGLDVALDPLWLIPPAKAAKMAKMGSKAIGLTDHVVEPMAKAVKNSRTGQAIIAGLEDMAGVNRVNDAGINSNFSFGRAQDALRDSDITDDLNKLGKIDEENTVTKYIEAADRPEYRLDMTPSMQTDILDSYKNGRMASDIAEGVYTKEDALDVLKKAGVSADELPDFLLQQHQVDAILKGENIPDYIYRDDILAGVQDVNLRNAIQQVGDSVIAQNKQYAEQLKKAGLLGDEALAHFQGGSHLRRSYEKYETPGDFLEALRKYGTPEEFQRAYADYQKVHGVSQMGLPAAHKINQADFMKRQRLSSETMEKMGLINDAEYRVADTFNRNSKALREMDYLSDVAKQFGETEERAAQLSRNLPKSREYVPIEGKEFGDLAGKWIPRDVAEQVKKRLGVGANDSGWWKKAVAHWKVGKLANPASIMRNFYSGLPMANVFGKVPLKDMPMLMTEAANAMRKGKDSQLWRDYLGSGAKKSKLTREELEGILDGNRGFMAHAKEGDIGGAVKGIEKAAMDAFGAPDDFWRLVTFAHYRKQGLSVQKAGDKARTALLDYENTPEWVAKLARTGRVPFARFPFHATKETAKAVWNNPASVSKYYKPANQVDDDVKEIYPDYLKPGNLLPVGEDTRIVNGEPQQVMDNIDVSYIMPFASDISISNPAMDIWRLAQTGQNGLGQQVIRPGMSTEDKIKAYADQVILNGIAPTALSKNYLERFSDAAQGKMDRMGRQYDMSKAVQQNLLGVKHVPINVDETFDSKMTRLDMQISDKEKEIDRIWRDARYTDEEKEEKTEKMIQEIERIIGKIEKTSDSYDRYDKKRERK